MLKCPLCRALAHVYVLLGDMAHSSSTRALMSRDKSLGGWRPFGTLPGLQAALTRVAYQMLAGKFDGSEHIAVAAWHLRIVGILRLHSCDRLYAGQRMRPYVADVVGDGKTRGLVEDSVP